MLNAVRTTTQVLLVLFVLSLRAQTSERGITFLEKVDQFPADIRVWVHIHEVWHCKHSMRETNSVVT